MHFLDNCLKIWSHLITFQARSKAEVWLELDHKNPVLCSNPIIGFLAFRLRKIAKDMLQTPKTCCKHFLRKTAFRADIFRVILSTKRCKNWRQKIGARMSNRRNFNLKSNSFWIVKFEFKNISRVKLRHVGFERSEWLKKLSSQSDCFDQALRKLRIQSLFLLDRTGLGRFQHLNAKDWHLL